MNIFVFVKRVPDTESRIRINYETNSVIEEGLNFILNPYDEFAVEEGLRLREAKGGKVTVLSVGNEGSLVILKKCLAMGADDAFLCLDKSAETYDGLRTARIIARAMERKFPDYNLLLFGKQSVNTDNSQVPSMVAEILGLPQVNVVTKLEIEGTKGVAHREIEGATEKTTFSLPVVISTQKGLNEPRYETLRGIMAAKKREIPVLTLEDLGLKEEEIAPQLLMKKMESPAPRQTGKMIEAPPEEASKKLVEFLHKEAKVI